ncbi:MAG: hypothetical protein ACHP78_03895 [Terriglobales bacterium]
MSGKRMRFTDAPDKHGKRARVLDKEEPDEQEEDYDPAAIASFDGRYHVGRVDDAGNIHIHRRRERTTDTKTVPMSTQLKKLNEAQRAFWARKS